MASETDRTIIGCSTRGTVVGNASDTSVLQRLVFPHPASPTTTVRTAVHVAGTVAFVMSDTPRTRGPSSRHRRYTFQLALVEEDAATLAPQPKHTLPFSACAENTTR